ncbi:MAG: ThuA domain-containing protein [Gemmataceae bacterium]|nr:ThuA domain-containing protein [Gemmataceae bacterium]
MFRRHLLLTVLVLATLTLPTWAEPKKKLLLIGQGPDGSHPAGTHEYEPGIRILARLLKDVPDLDVTVVKADGAWKDGPELMERADGVVLFVAEGATWLKADPKRYEALTKVAKRGGGLVALHWSVGTRDPKMVPDFLKLFGACHGGDDRKYKVVEELVEVAEHPINVGVKDFKVKDEFYYRLKMVQPDKGIRPVLRVPIDGEKETVVWTWDRPEGGRTLGFTALHFHENWRVPEYRRILAQGVLWTLKLPIPEKGLPVDVKDEELKLK